MTATKKISNNEYQASIDKQQAIKALRRLAPRGSTLYTVCKDISSSGMRRLISVYVIGTREHDGVTEPYIQWLDGWISRLGEFARHKERDALVVRGTGMDEGFFVVYETACAVWDGDGYAYKHSWL